jgi:cell division protein FtsQ
VSRLWARRNRYRESGAGTLRRERLVQALTVVAGGGLLVALGLLVLPALDAARRHPYFAVRDVVIRHRGRLPAAEIQRVLGVGPGTSIWDVDEVAAAERLREEGWVRSAAVERELPDRVVVRVREHRPRLIVVTADDGEPVLYYAAGTGELFARVGTTDGRDLPYVTGLTNADFEGGDGFGPRALHQVLGVLRMLGRRGGPVSRVSEIHVDRQAGLTLMPAEPPVAIELGWEEFGPKLRRLEAVLPRWTGREHEIRSVSCVFDDEVIVRTRPVQKNQKGRKARGA